MGVYSDLRCLGRFVCIIDKQMYLKPTAVAANKICLITLQLDIAVLLQLSIQNENECAI